MTQAYFKIPGLSKTTQPTAAQRKKLSDQFEGRGSLEVVKELLAQVPALVNTDLGNGNRPLHLAAASGQTALLKLLLASGARVDAKNCYRQSPLHLAAEAGHKRIVELLLAANADINARQWQELSPLTLALNSEKGQALVPLLKRAGAKK